MINKEARDRRNNYLMANVGCVLAHIEKEAQELKDCTLAGQLEKTAILPETLGGALIGTPIGAIRAKKGKRVKGANYGAIKGAGTGLGLGIGSGAGAMLGSIPAMIVANKIANGEEVNPVLASMAGFGPLAGALTGGGLGMYAGHKVSTPVAEAATGNTWEEITGNKKDKKKDGKKNE